MTRRIRIVFLQLPLIDPGNESAEANIPFAAGYLAQAASGMDVECLFPDQATVCYGTDSSVLDAVTEADPDILACTAYMWNVERSLDIAGGIKERVPRCQVWMGGPEIQAGTPWLKDGRVDRFFIGEGEASFIQAIAEFQSGAATERILRRQGPERGLEGSPFASGILGMGPRGRSMVETMRGCRSRCRYCYYGKSHSDIRLFPDRALSDFFAWARKNGTREIYLMDPALDQRPGFPGFLGDLAAWNPSSIPLHTELCAESVTKSVARDLKGCGVRSVEVGLQSVTPGALKIAQRAFNRERFLAGVNALMGEGIEVRAGIILGLPGDSLSGFEETLEFASSAGIGRDAEVYPLSVLPATAFREDAGDFGIEYLPLPPYVVTGSQGWEPDDFRLAQYSVEDILGKGLYQTVIPRFPGPVEGARGRIARWAGMQDLARSDFRFSSSLCLLVRAGEFPGAGALDSAAARFRKENPRGAVQIVLESDRPSDSEGLALSDAFFDPGHYQDRLRIHADDSQGRFGTRLFNLSSNAAEIRRLMDGEGFCEPIYRISAEAEPDLELLSDWAPLIAGDRAALTRWEGRIAERYGGPDESIIRLPEEPGAR
jgi:hypothetical protein